MSLLPVFSGIGNLNKHYQTQFSSDIDLCFWGLDEQAFTQKLNYLYDHFNKVVNGQLLMVKTGVTLTFVFEYPLRRVQLVLGSWARREDVFLACDIDCTYITIFLTGVNFIVLLDLMEVVCIQHRELSWPLFAE